MDKDDGDEVEMIQNDKTVPREVIPNYQTLLPDELIFNIFAKLPAKSVCRFRCISDQWNTTFSDNHFIKAHHHNSLLSPSPSSCLIAFPNRTNKAKLIYCAAPSDPTLIAVADLHVSVPGWVHSQVTESVNGLICFDIEKLYRICNPTTRDFITLPPSPALTDTPGKSMIYDITTFGYDSVHDRYKVLNSWVVSSAAADGVMSMEHYVFVLGTHSWRRIDDCVLHFSRREGVCLNSALYYRASCSQLKQPGEILVEFDVRLETFRFHTLSVAASGLNEDYTSLISLDGKLAIVDYQHVLSKSKVDFWVCEDLANRRWVHKRIRFSCAWKGDMNMHTGGGASQLVLNFAGTTRAGEIIMAPSSLSDPFYLIYFSLKNGKARRVQIQGLPYKGLRFGITSNRL